MDVVWLKRDIRLHDHAPLAEVSRSITTTTTTQQKRPFCILYLYEPDQLSHDTVHGSHYCFVNESLVDMDSRLAASLDMTSSATAADDVETTITKNTVDLTVSGEKRALRQTKTNSKSTPVFSSTIEEENEQSSTGYTFQCLTVVHAGAVYTFDTIHRQSTCPPIQRILAHEETGHLKSYARDKAVRRWCRSNKVEFVEFNQTGVTRCLSNRDDFSDKLNQHLNQPLHKINIQYNLRQRLLGATTFELNGQCTGPLPLQDVTEIPIEHRIDRKDRQYGGETKALATLNSFLTNRGARYASGISSPNSSWTTGSRLSPYLTWGNISLRYVIHAVRNRQVELRATKKQQQQSQKTAKKKSKKNATTISPSGEAEIVEQEPSTSSSSSASLGGPQCPWLRSLSAFSSRIHWRAHFIQKLETEPEMEKYDLCKAYQPLRRQPTDWNETYYHAWSTGTTGYPFVDACMRCLIRHGWLNFRMRAMLVSFATYNLWLDWKRLAPHLARLFLDYEPGIHYPQLQMQAGTTGINAMRVYNVTKQGKDQDPQGIFIRKYVPELQNIPKEYIHEPWKMPPGIQKKFHIKIGAGGNDPSTIFTESKRENLITPKKKQRQQQSLITNGHVSIGNNNKPHCATITVHYYPKPIVDEKETGRIAKQKVAEVRKQLSTKRQAEQVFVKHGSRNARNAEMNGITRKALSSTAKRIKVDDPHITGQRTIEQWSSLSLPAPHEALNTSTTESNEASEVTFITTTSTTMDTDSVAAHIEDGLETVQSPPSQKQQDLEHNHLNLFFKTSERTKTIKQPSVQTKTPPPSQKSIAKSFFIARDQQQKGNNDGIKKPSADCAEKRISGHQQIIIPVSDQKLPTSLQIERGKGSSVLSTISWNCSACTFLNDKPYALACLVCGTVRPQNNN